MVASASSDKAAHKERLEELDAENLPPDPKLRIRTFIWIAALLLLVFIASSSYDPS